MSKRYDSLGVSASKDEIHQAIAHLDKGLFPNAFCKVLPDLVGKDKDFCNLIHADTAGTKTSLAYLYWKETGDVKVWKGISQDSLVMNLDDLACVGAVDNIVVSSTIGRNKHRIPGAVIQSIIEGTEDFLDLMNEFGVNIYSGGGETADVGDIVRTIDVGITAFARIPRADIIPISIKPGAVIVGLSSSGQTLYETEYNSGIGSNGLTAARHDVLTKKYLTQFPESCAPETPDEVKYTGKYNLLDAYVCNGVQHEVGKLLLSPTRTYLPFLVKLIAEHRKNLQGIIHCTGGAQTKVKKFIKGLRVIKDNLFDPPPVFQMIAECSLCTPHELYEVYNMGHRMEIYVDEIYTQEIISLAAEMKIEAQIIGRVEASDHEEVHIHKGKDIFKY
ncbi:MAG: phosphoribosylformylglycinamidine cyclo-ligase [Saprospiraceae bacterium]|nr:phosphoribosylformylglycinamidine cyclo-ligase [Candidatus Vicinibacter affinis]MBK7798970.1 phosphoribosylformylglycinamidine cyclo-ligase [Candidatus Vicinibacter affinis]MBP6174224.1 phosphoribosylformylglycinamidine cyclo-ligase [Saprospiraceae bacterium]